MDSRERVLTALSCNVPDVVPFMFAFMDSEVQEKILGYSINQYMFDLSIDPGIIVVPGDKIPYSINYTVHPETARKLSLDAIGVRFPVPLFCATRYGRGGHNIEKGLLESREILKKITLPDPDDEKLYRDALNFLKKYKGEFAIYAQIRLGVSSTLMSMGYDNFSYSLIDDIDLTYEVVDLYTTWMSSMVHNICELGFDFIWTFDDLAFNSGPLFSLDVWNDVFFPRLKKVTDNISCPWIYHSDGNILPLLDAMIPLGMSGIHPLEPGTMDLKYLKKNYGKKLCLIGNIDTDYTLSKAKVDEVDTTVKERISQLAHDGGYIISDSNSIPYFCHHENIIAMSDAVKKYRNYYS